MRIARTTMLAMAAMLAASGCRAWSPGGSLTPSTRPLSETSFDVDAFVAEHNRNADRVQSLEAKPAIGVRGRVMGANADGRLALVRPRNFKLELSVAGGSKKADIGSNDEEFWFWVDTDDSKVYWCDYDKLDSSTLAITYQPDWIIEALGLKPITPEEAAGIKLHAGEVRDTTALVFPPTKNRGETFTRMIIVWTKTHRIKQHRIYEGSEPTTRGLLARAEVSSFADFPVSGSDDTDGEKCFLPENVKLEWLRDRLVLDVAMQADAVKVNQFDPSRSAALFVEPVTGHDRVNLAELSRSQKRDPFSRVRQTLPSPAPRTKASAGRSTAGPTEDTTMAPRAKSRNAGSRATSPLEDLVSAPLPVGPDTDLTKSAGSVANRADVYQIGR